MRLAQRVTVNAVSQLLAQIAAAVATLVGLGFTSRYLSVAQFGEIQAAFALATMFAFVGDLGLSTVGARTLARADAREIDGITGALLAASVAFTLTLLVVAVGIAFAAYHGTHALARQAALILFVPLLLTPWATVARAHAVWRQRAWVLSVTTLGARLVSVGCVIAVARLHAGPHAVAFAYALSGILAAIGLVWWQRESLRLPSVRLGRSALALAGAGLSLSVITVLNAVYFRLDAFLLSLLSSSRSVALYTLAYRALDGLVLVPGFVMVTLVPELARTDPRSARSRRLVGECLTGVWLLVMPVGAGVLVAPQLVIALGGERYRAASTVLALLLPGAVLACLNAVLGNALVAQSRQRPLIAVSAANLVLNAALNLVLIPPLGARGAAIALVATEVVSLVATAAVYMRGAGAIMPPRAGRSLIAGAACAAAMCLRFVVGTPDRHAALVLVVALVPAGVVYALALWRLRLVPEPARALAAAVFRPGRASRATARPSARP